MFKKTKRQKAAIRTLSSQATNILLYGGSRSGKTAICCYSLIVRALRSPNSRHAIFRLRFVNVRQTIGLDTLPKIINLAFPELVEHVKLDKKDWVFRFPNGSEIWLLGLDDEKRVEKVLGLEFATMMFDECSQLSYSSIMIALTRLAQKTDLPLKKYFLCNPPIRSHWIHKMFIEHKNPISGEPLDENALASLLMNPCDNIINIADGYIDELSSTLTVKQRRRFILGEWGDDTEGALWKLDNLEKNRLYSNTFDFDIITKIAIGFDPAVSSDKDSSEHGIIVCGRDANGHGYVFDDYSGIYSPSKVSKVIDDGYDDWQANFVICEKNNGGEFVESMLHTQNKAIKVESVSATKNKQTRAEPIVALYEQNKIHHVGYFPDLEYQMTSWVPDSGDKSPDRMDAMVWAFSKLFLKNGLNPRIRTV